MGNTIKTVSRLFAKTRSNGGTDGTADHSTHRAADAGPICRPGLNPSPTTSSRTNPRRRGAGNLLSRANGRVVGVLLPLLVGVHSEAHRSTCPAGILHGLAGAHLAGHVCATRTQAYCLSHLDAITNSADGPRTDSCRRSPATILGVGSEESTNRARHLLGDGMPVRDPGACVGEGLTSLGLTITNMTRIGLQGLVQGELLLLLTESLQLHRVTGGGSPIREGVRGPLDAFSIECQSPCLLSFKRNIVGYIVSFGADLSPSSGSSDVLR